jgi:hypothetical protein
MEKWWNKTAADDREDVALDSVDVDVDVDVDFAVV